jgi:lipid-A-disaccharide synthase
MTSPSVSETPTQVFFSVGEPSGDLHGANLIRALRRQHPGIRAVGFGGPRMKAAGMEQLTDLTELAVMWVLQAVINIHRFWQLLRQADKYFGEHHPDAVILIDYPGFNWWIARKAKKHGIPVFYYGAPQMWAWASFRVRKMRRLVDHVLCKLPFEARWYMERGCNAIYVGHPYFDQLTEHVPDREFMHREGSRQQGRLVTILPGSRTQEVTNNLPWLLKAAEEVHQQVPQARFAIAAFNEKQARMARQMLAGCGLPIQIFVHRTAELIQISHCCLACSGSVSLELMFHTKPSAILYWVNRTTHFLVKHLIVRVKYITLVNLLACEDRFERTRQPYDPHAAGAEKVPFPEYPTCEDKSAQLAEHVIRWLTDPSEYHQRVAQLADLKSRFCATGASTAAADYILRHLVPEKQVDPSVSRAA